MASLKELSTVKFLPKLNLKTAEETHQDSKKLKKGLKKEIEPYYINVAEELSAFDQWCVTDINEWGIPVPQFIYKDTGDIMIDGLVINHFAKLVEEYGTSDIWHTFDVYDLLPPEYKGEAEKLEKQFIVFDSWFDSSLSWKYVLDDGKKVDLHHKNPLFPHISGSLGFKNALEAPKG